ncbi:Uncharacterised protein [Mycobacteroides abscessus subsp. abscessus]|nr:Uncharacterised protein [Mycobacteroides abscessus subsp. abscessus]SLG75029.1 Uncharacterised protein [Mycobacteroides abscessus subsp. abscessus]
MLVEQLCELIADVEEQFNFGAAQYLAEKDRLTGLQRRSVELALELEDRRLDLPWDVVLRQALTVLALKGSQTGFEFRLGCQRLVVLGVDSVWKLAFNARGAETSELEVAAALPAPVSPASWRLVAGVQVVEMERVEVLAPEAVGDDELRASPWWADVDRHMLGRRRSGELVVFDAGQFGAGNRQWLSDARKDRLRALG